MVALHPDFQEIRNFRRDIFNVVVGTIWQTSLVLLPMYVVLLNWRAVAVWVGTLAIAWVLPMHLFYRWLPCWFIAAAAYAAFSLR